MIFWLTVLHPILASPELPQRLEFWLFSSCVTISLLPLEVGVFIFPFPETAKSARGRRISLWLCCPGCGVVGCAVRHRVRFKPAGGLREPKSLPGPQKRGTSAPRTKTSPWGPRTWGTPTLSLNRRLGVGPPGARFPEEIQRALPQFPRHILKQA